MKTKPRWQTLTGDTQIAETNRADASRFCLPAEIRSSTVREFVWYIYALEQEAGRAQVRDYAGASAQERLLTLKRLVRLGMELNVGDGDDLLCVRADRADTCKQCIGAAPDENHLGIASRSLLVRGLDKQPAKR